MLLMGTAAGSKGSGAEPLRHCAGKVQSTSTSYGWWIRVKRMTCGRAAQLNPRRARSLARRPRIQVRAD